MGSRKTLNSQKVANMDNITGAESKSPTLNQAFLGEKETDQAFNMASMQEIVNGQFLNEAFENMSTDEKLSLILTELYKMRDNISSLTKAQGVTKQKVDAHEQELNLRATPIFGNGPEEEDALARIKESLTTTDEALETVQQEGQALEKRIADVESQVNLQTRDINLLKGTVHRQHKLIASNQHKITDLTMRSMDHNLTISRLEEIRNENCKMTVLEFFRKELALQIDQKDLLVAHRMGAWKPGKPPRLMVIKVTTDLKERILLVTSRLKGKVNAQG